MTPNADRRTLVQNASALLGGHAVGLIVPLLTVPYLARVLRPEGWAPVLVAQAFAAWLVLVVEFGFDLSATRAVARARLTPDRLPDIVCGVQSAKLLLVPITCAIFAVALMAMPHVRSNRAMAASAIVFAICRGFSPFWYFQGMERVRRAVAIESSSKAAAALLCFVVVRGPADGWLVIALQAAFAAASLVILTVRMAAITPLRRPSMTLALAALRDSTHIFAFRASAGLYIQANAIILAALASAPTVAFFGGAERIVRSAVNLLQPLTQAFFPRVSFLTSSDPAAARRTVERSMIGIGGFGAILGLGALIGAPLLVRVLLGHGYEAAIPVVRALAPLPLLAALGTVLGLYWAIPFGHERAFLGVVLTAGIVNLALAFLLVPLYGALGMAGAVVIAESFVTVALAVLYVRRRGEVVDSLQEAAA